MVKCMHTRRFVLTALVVQVYILTFCFRLIALAVLDCKVSKVSMQAVMHVLKVAGTTVNLLVKRQYTNPLPTGVKEYLKQNLTSFRSCVLVVDAEAVKCANQGTSHLNVEYEELFKTALDEVGKFSIQRASMFE